MGVKVSSNYYLATKYQVRKGTATYEPAARAQSIGEEITDSSEKMTPNFHPRCSTLPDITYNVNTPGRVSTGSERKVGHSTSPEYSFQKDPMNFRRGSFGFISKSVVTSCDDPFQIFLDNITKRSRVDSFDVSPDVNSSIFDFIFSY